MVTDDDDVDGIGKFRNQQQIDLRHFHFDKFLTN